MNDEIEIDAVKILQINANANYPIVTAYEFEFLKTEKVVQDLYRPCTIYLILQRSLLYIHNLTTDDGVIKFIIKDDRGNKPLLCSFSPKENGFINDEEDVLVNIHFYKHEADTEPPFNDVAAIKMFSEENQFIVWYTPQKIIYEYLRGSLKADIRGDLKQYIDYKIHYIGQAFSQEIWERLTGHSKMQSILTKENSISEKTGKNSFEISLMLLDIDSFSEAIITPFYPEMNFLDQDVEPIIHKLKTDEDFERFYEPFLEIRSQELTNEVEAMLINSFKPEYNDILFKNYPNIKTGVRSAGYTGADLLITCLPATISTENHFIDLILPENS